MATLPGLRVGIALDSATFIAETRRVNSSVQRMGRDVERQSQLMTRSFNRMTAAAKGLAAGLVAGLGVGSVAGLARTAKGALDAAGNLGELAAQGGRAEAELLRRDEGGDRCRR